MGPGVRTHTHHSAIAQCAPGCWRGACGELQGPEDCPEKLLGLDPGQSKGRGKAWTTACFFPPAFPRELRK